MTTTSAKGKIKEQTALKLLTKYADEYHVLEKINQQLLKENADLKTTLKINKDIIEGYIINTIKDNNSLIVKKQNEEIGYISLRLNEVVAELNKSKQLVALTQNTANRFESELESANRKLFVLENILQEKENIIRAFNENESNKKRKVVPITTTGSKTVIENNDQKVSLSKQSKLQESQIKKKNSTKDKNHQRINSEIIYVASPNCILNQIHAELALAKEDNCELIKEICSLKDKISSKDGTLKLLEQKIKEKNAYVKKAKEKEAKDNQNSNKPRQCKENNILFKQVKDNFEMNMKQIKAINSEEEWRQILTLTDMTQDEYHRLTRLQLMKKPCAMIEALYKLLNEKNEYLKLILQENKRLVSSNLKLNKVNIEQSYKLSSSFQVTNQRTQLQENSSIAYLSTYCNGCSLKLTDNNHDNTTMGLNHSNTLESEEQNRTIVQNVHNISMSSSLNSNDFRIGMALDQFDLLSELSNQKYRHNTKE